MDFANMSLAQKKMLGAGAACVLYVLALFLPWYGVADFNKNGWSALPSGWLWAAMGAAAAVIFIMSALGNDLPIPVPPFALAFYLISVPFLMSLAMLLESTDAVKFGFFIALLASAAGTVLAVMIAREQEG